MLYLGRLWQLSRGFFKFFRRSDKDTKLIDESRLDLRVQLSRFTLILLDPRSEISNPSPQSRNPPPESPRPSYEP